MTDAEFSTIVSSIIDGVDEATLQRHLAAVDAALVSRGVAQSETRAFLNLAIEVAIEKRAKAASAARAAELSKLFP